MKRFMTPVLLGVATLSLAACSSDGVTTPVGPSDAVALSVQPPPPAAIPLFVIGDAEAHDIGDQVNFWGAQWWKHNAMTGAVSHGVAAFKGYMDISDNACGGTWSSRPGNSSNPPDVIDGDVAVVVTSSIVKNGADINGDIQQIVIVHHDGGYGPNPGHSGSGTVSRVVCSQ
jgi:hypothetical protein